MRTLEYAMVDFECLKKSLEVYDAENSLWITDSNVFELHPAVFEKKSVFVLPAGEVSKSLSTYIEIITRLDEMGLKRNSTLVAVGGGVVGDISAFAASTFKRGMNLIHVPTTLLSMVDSSIGGKTGINFGTGKNNVGSFYVANKNYVCTEFLSTLPQREWQCGFAEVIKYALVYDETLLDLIELLLEENQNESSLIEEMVSRCVAIKDRVVQEDPFDFGERQKLNFGHTIGHALERFYEYESINHGEAVAVGITAQVIWSHLNNKMYTQTFKRLFQLMNRLKLWRRVDQAVPINQLVLLMLSDKKNDTEDIVWFEIENLCQVRKVKGSVEMMQMLLEKVGDAFEEYNNLRK